MVFQYEALVGHLFVVNGRTIGTPPPGALVEVAPKRASRGREADTIFILITPAGIPVTAKFYTDLAETAAERYFNSSGSVTAGLRALYDTLNRNLLAHNKTSPQPYEVNLVCAVLHDNTLILSRCGVGMALVHQGETGVLFPADPLDENELIFGPPLGVQAMPDIKFKQLEVEAGTRLILGDGELADIPRDSLRVAASQSDIETVLVRLQLLAEKHATVLAAQLVPPESDEDPFMPAGDNSREVAKRPVTPEQRVENVELDPAIGTRLVDSVTQMRDGAQMGVSQAAKGIAKGAEVTDSLIGHYFGQDDTKPKWWAGTFGATVAIGIPMVVVALVIVLWLLNIDRSEYEVCVGNAFETANIARNIDSADVNGTLAGWNAVLLKIGECDTLRPEGIPDQPMRELEREGQAVVDRLLTIDRRTATPMVSLPSAMLSQVVLRGLTMYVLDDANDIVYQLQLRADGRSVEPNTQAPIPNMRRGAPVNQFTVGDIIDIAWAEDGSALSQSNVLIAVDREGVLVEHSPTILTRGSQRLLGSEQWVNPVAIQIWRGNLYILDPGANQIWRYSPTGGSYAAAPTEYFVGQQRPNVSQAVDFSIDNNGSVYVLLENGQMGKYVSGEVQTFAFANFPPGQELGTADAMYLSTSPIAQSIFIASQPNRTVYEVTQAGTFMRSYRTYDEEQFTTLKAVTAEPGQQVIYALSGNSVFVFDRDG